MPPKDLWITVVLAASVAASAAVVLPGCSGEEAPILPDLPQVKRGSGRIVGTVRFVGTPPTRTSQLVACDPRPDAARKEVWDNSVVVSDTGGFADVYVFIKSSADGTPLKGSGVSEPPLILDQVDCVFTPHALAIQVGQRLRLRNSDPTFHNIHWDPKLNRAVNFGFTPAPASGERVVALTAAEFFPVRCDVHPWMRSHIGVFDHPFFATSGSDGSFTITGIPAGTYTVTSWHPVFGAGQELTVVVAETGDATPVEFTFQPPSSGTAPR